MRPAIYAAAALAGAGVALLGSEPIWAAAVAAVIVFPLAAGSAERRSRPDRRGRQAPLLPSALAALAGSLLVVLLVRLALAAPGWLSETTADCGGASEGVQQLVLWSSALAFAAAATPIGIILFGLAGRLRDGPAGGATPVPLSLYPLAVAASGVALIAAGYVTNC